MSFWILATIVVGALTSYTLIGCGIVRLCIHYDVRWKGGTRFVKAWDQADVNLTVGLWPLFILLLFFDKFGAIIARIAGYER